MKRFMGVSIAVAVLVTGCSSSDQATSDSATISTEESSAESSDSTVADPQVVDTMLGHFVEATYILTNMQAETVDQAIGEFEAAQNELTEMGAALQSGIPGIPEQTSEDVLGALDRIQASIDDLIACFDSSATASCDAESDVASEDARALGVEVAALVPYGSLSEDEFLAALSGTTNSEDTAVEDTEMDTTTSETVSQSNAREKAQSYLDYSAFSRQGLIEQLEYEGFTSSQATYGVNAVGL